MLLRFDWSSVISVINLIVLFLLMKKFLVGPVMNIIEKRKELIASQLTNADQVQQEALLLKTQYEETLKTADQKADEIIVFAKKRADEEYDRKIKEANEETKAIIGNADKEIKMEREKALQDVQTEIADLALLAAAKIISDKQRDDKSVYRDFLKKAGDSYDASSN